eukprot:jgi/Ulvmu1/6551/UM003_0185.1
MLTTLLKNCNSLGACPRELWLVFIAKALESYSYFSMSIIYVIFLTDTFGVGDVAAGGSYGVWGMLTVAWGVLMGPAIDYLGIRTSLLLCFTGELLTRVIIATSSSKTVVYLVLYTLLPAASSLGIPVMTIAVKRYTPPTSARSLAYGLFYTIMNFAALVMGFAIDGLRALACRNRETPGDGGTFATLMRDSSRLVIASGAVASGVALLIALALRPQAEAGALSREHAADSMHAAAECSNAVDGVEEGLLSAEPQCETPEAHSQREEHEQGTGGANGSGGGSKRPSVASAARSVVGGVAELLAYPGMWTYMVMALFLLNLGQVFRFMDSMLPKYMQRSISCSAPYGKIYAINPAMIIALVPLVSAATAGVQHFDMIHYGSYVSASSPFWVQLLRNAPILGPAVFVVQESLGEAFWSPRWYDYTMDIAPTGKEGLFGAIAAAPLFLAKLPTGLLSGFLLGRLCPRVGAGCGADGGHVCMANAKAAAAAAGLAEAAGGGDAGTCNPVIWSTVGVVTMMSPVLITAFAWLLRPAPRQAGGGRAGTNGDFSPVPVQQE